MSVPVFKHWMSPHIRRNRLSFLWAYLALCFMFLLSFVAIEALVTIPFLYDMRNFFGICSVVLFMGFKCILGTQRLHDFNVTGWVALLITISLFTTFLLIQVLEGRLWYVTETGGATYLTWSLWLIIIVTLSLIPGTEGKNDYGKDPLKKMKRKSPPKIVSSLNNKNMSVPVLEHWVLPSIRRNGISFFLASLVLYFMLFVVIASLSTLDNVTFLRDIRLNYTEYIFILFPLFLLFIYFKCILVTQRLHDFNVTGWVAVLIIISLVSNFLFGLVGALSSVPSRNPSSYIFQLGWSLWPITIVILSLIPGTKGKNKYAEYPLKGMKGKSHPKMDVKQITKRGAIALNIAACWVVWVATLFIAFNPYIEYSTQIHKSGSVSYKKQIWSGYGLDELLFYSLYPSIIGLSIFFISCLRGATKQWRKQWQVAFLVSAIWIVIVPSFAFFSGEYYIAANRYEGLPAIYFNYMMMIMMIPPFVGLGLFWFYNKLVK